MRDSSAGASRRLALRLAAGLCVWAGTAAGLNAQVSPRAADDAFQHLRAPDNPEAVALFINQLARYAAGAPQTDDFGQRIARALSAVPRSREIAQRLIENFHSVPLAVRQAAFGAFADPVTLAYRPGRTEAVFKEMLLAAGPADPAVISGQGRMPLPTRTPSPTSASAGSTPSLPPAGPPKAGTPVPLRIRFKGFKCFGETSDVREGGSDEIYVIAGVYGEYMVKLPMGEKESVFEGIDAGEVQNGPIATVGLVAPRPLTLVVYVWNHNFSQPSEVREGIELLLKAAESFGDPFVAVAAKVVGIISSWAFAKDRLIQEMHVMFDGERMEAMAATPLREYEGIQSHFDTYHTDNDASYAVYFDLFREPPPVTADARLSRRVPSSQPGAGITALVPRDGHIDLFGVSTDGAARTSWWEGGTGWSEWYLRNPETRFPAGGAVTALVPREGHIDLFAVDAAGMARTAWWEPQPSWSHWYPRGPETRFPPGAPIAALVPRAGHIDLFAVDAGGVTRTSWWEPATSWSEWIALNPETRLPAGGTVTALVPRDGHIDLFAVGADGVVQTMWWESGTGWTPWRPLRAETRFTPGAAVTALVPREGHIDLFAVDADGVARTSWWEPTGGWSQWYPLYAETRFPRGATLTPLVPRDGHIDLFSIGADGVAQTAWWEGASGWTPWRPLRPETRFAPGAAVTALVPREGHIDLFAVSTDGVVRTAWWEPATSWSEWFPLRPETRFSPNK